MPKKNKAPERMAFTGSGNISFTLTETPATTKKPGDFHWTPTDRDLLRQFLSKCALEFGGRKAGAVLERLVEKWLRGKVKVRL